MEHGQEMIITIIKWTGRDHGWEEVLLAAAKEEDSAESVQIRECSVYRSFVMSLEYSIRFY